MCPKQCLSVPERNTCESTSLLLLRLFTGVAFLFHGWGKIQNPLAWMGPDAPVPGVFQFLAAFAEFGGGIALILGLLTPLAAIGLAFTMAVAVYMHMIVFKDPFVGGPGQGSYEPALGYLIIALVIKSLGPGKFSLDAKIFGSREACK